MNLNFYFSTTLRSTFVHDEGKNHWGWEVAVRTPPSPKHPTEGRYMPHSYPSQGRQGRSGMLLLLPLPLDESQRLSLPGTGTRR